MKKVTSKDFPVVGDGIADDSAALQAALDVALTEDALELVIEPGIYRITTALRVHSNTHICAQNGARMLQCGETPKFRGDFLIRNADLENGNVNICITGGVWDGNNSGRCNVKCPDLFDTNGYSGATMNFVNVRGLTLSDFRIENSVAFYVRMSRLRDFTIRNLVFLNNKLGRNQDGLHFGGEVYNGLIEHIYAHSKGQTNDDLIALNADDCVTRVDNFDLARGPIENLVIRDIYAEDCHTFVRALSVDAPIRNIRIEQVHGGFRAYAVNLDAARYCRTPLFQEEERPQGVGVLENVHMCDFFVHRTRKGDGAAYIVCESNAKNVTFTNFIRNEQQDADDKAPTLRVVNVTNMNIAAKQMGEQEKTVFVTDKKQEITMNGSFEALSFNA